MGKFDLKDPRGWFRRVLLDLDARIDSTLFSSGSGARIRLSDSSYQGNQRLAALWAGTTDQTTDRYGAGAQATRASTPANR